MNRLIRFLSLVFTSFFLLANIDSSAQITLSADSVICNASSTTLHAAITGTTPNSSGITIDDTWSDSVFSIGFNFNFYGTNYSRCIIGANGAIGFDTTLATSSFGYVISSALLGNTTVLNCVCGPWCDIDIFYGGTIDYATVGTAPYRKFVVSFCHDAMFSCTTQWTTSQIILYETTNLIEVHIAHKDTCAWNGGYAIVGVQNATGTAATAAPGRDFPSVWTATNEAWRFTPNASYTSYTASSISYATVPLAASTIYWYDNTGALLGTGASLPVSPVVPTTYHAVAVGCDDSSTSYINVDLAALNIGGPGGARAIADFNLAPHPGCLADTIVLSNNSMPSGGTSVWNFGDGTPLDSSVTNPRHIYVVQGTYGVHLTYRDRFGCVDTLTKTVTFNHSVSSAFTASTYAVCLGSPITFNNTSTGTGAQYLWNFGDGTTSSAFNPTHNYANGGNYHVTLTVTDNVPCTASMDTPILVVSFGGHAEPHDTIVCLRQPMQLFSSVFVNPDSLNNIVYTWSPATNLSDANVAQPFFSGIGDYTYNFTATILPFGCTISDVVNIHSKPPLVLTNVTPDRTIVLGQSVQLDAQGAYIYTWTPNDGTLSDPNINNPIATPTDSVVVYRVIGMSRYGCKDTAEVTIHVDQNEDGYIPAAFTPNGDGLNDVFRLVNYKWKKLVDFRIFNRWGQEVFQTADVKKGWDGTLNGTPQDIGTYYYHVVVATTDGSEKTISGNVSLIR